MKIQDFITISSGVMALTFAPRVIAQTTPGPQPTICTRSCWGARAPNGTCGSITGLNRVIIHHTAAASHWNTTSQATSGANVRGLQNYDMDVEGYCDIEYHWMIDKFGNIFEARYGSMTGLHRAYHDACNNNSHGVSFMAYFHPPHNHIPSQTMLNQLYALIAWRMPAGWSPYGTASYCYGAIGVIDGHRKVVATACPGDGFYPLIGDDRNGGTVRNAVAARRGGGVSPGGKPAEFDPGNAAWYLRNSNTIGGIDNSFYFGIAGDIPIMGDWDGNGSITPGVFRPSTAQWFLRNSNSNGGVDYTFYFGVGSDIPVVGDWDGNGTFTPGVFRPSTAQWYLRNSNSNGGVDHAFAFGAVGDQPIVGDWDGNRTSTPGVFRPSTAAFYLSNTLNGALGGWFYFGAVNDSAIAGDWNADGYWTVGVYRNGIRYLSNSNLNPTTDIVFTYGANHNRHLVWR